MKKIYYQVVEKVLPQVYLLYNSFNNKFILLNNVTVINPNKNADKPIQMDLNLFSVSFFHSLPYALIIALKLGFCNTF